MYLIRNGMTVDPETDVAKKQDLLLDGGKILRVGERLEAEGAEVIDAEGLIVAPGLMDAHVHFRDPGFTWKEDIQTGSAAAAAGGVTTVVCMANTKPPIDSPQILEEQLKRNAASGIRILQTANVTRGLKGLELTDMEGLAAAGAAGFTDDGIPILDEAILTEAMKMAAKLDLPISLHEEDPLYVKQAGVNMGEVSRKLGYGGASAQAEDVMVARDCVIALYTGAPTCIQHISSRVSVELVRTAKKLGADIHAEATPHHFTLTEEAVLRYGTNARMNPPVRTEEDRQAIIEGLCDGTIDMIVTDHAPHSAEEKAQELAKAPSGIIGLETSLGLGLKTLVEPGILSLPKLLRLMSSNPARFYRMNPGRIAEGAPADLVLFGEKELRTVSAFASKSSNSPFIGWELPGKIHYTFCDGKVVYRGL